MPYLTEDTMAAGDLVAVTSRHWFGAVELPGEPTEHAALMLVPDVHATDTRARRPLHQVRYTGHWSLIHTPTGHAVSPRYGLPLEWLRRFARLVATCGVDWHTVEGDTRLVTHPQHMVVRSLGEHVLRCWLAAAPVGPGQSVSWQSNADGYTSLHCSNTWCEDDMFAGEPAVLADGEGDEARLHPDEDRAELEDLARSTGWSQRAEFGGSYWLCETCTQGHQPPAEPIVGRLRHRLGEQ